MWLFKKQDEKCDESMEQSINTEVSAIEEVSSSTSLFETKTANTLEALRKRTEYVNDVFLKLEMLKKKTPNNDANTSDAERAENVDEKLGPAYEELKRNFEINSRRLEDVLRLVPILESQLQAVSQKVNTLCDC